MAHHSASRLSRNAEWAAQLYQHVARSTGRDVHLADLEEHFDFEWKLVNDGEVWTDPYFFRVLETEITGSLGRLFDAISTACRDLPGINPAERSADADFEAQCACNLLTNRLGAALVDVAMDQGKLLAIVEQACLELYTSAHRKALERIQCQTMGVTALQRLCAAVYEGRSNLWAELDKGTEAISYIVRFPPTGLSNDLERAGVPLGELGAYLNPVVPARMNGTITCDCVSRWAMTHYHAVTTACVSALNAELRDMATVPSTWHGYAGVTLWHRERDAHLVHTAVETGGYSAVTECPSASHTHAFKKHVIVATSTAHPVAMRVARIASIAHAIVRSKLLRPRTVRAEHLLALISRFGSEAFLACERAMDDEADEADAMEEEGLLLPAPPPRIDPPAPVAAAPVETPDPPFQPLMVTLREARNVPKSLQRDFVLVAVIRDQLSKCTFSEDRAYVGISAVCERLYGLPDMGEPVSPMIYRFSTPSLTMTITHVMNEKIAKSIGEWAQSQNVLAHVDSDVEYGETPAFVSGSKGLSVTRRGRQVLMTYTSWVVQQMQPPTGPVFANTWHTSRSAKSHARRKQLQPSGTVGVE